MRYKIYKWRRIMGVSYADMRKTPAHVIIDDLDMIGLENKFSKPLKTERR